MIKINMCILLLVTIIFISCKFFGKNITSKEEDFLLDATSNISNPGSVTSGQQGRNTNNVTTDETALAQVDDRGSSFAMFADDSTANSSAEKQEEKDTKLTKEDEKKLNAFFKKTGPYQYGLDNIYNKYTGSYNTIDTYTACNSYSIGCFSKAPSARRSQALDTLKKLNLDQEYSSLNNMLKEAAFGYDKKDLENTIKEYEEAINQAIEAESKIEKVKDYKEAIDADEKKKKENIVHLKNVRNFLPVIKKTIEVASIAYANAYASIADSLSSMEFKKAIKDFSVAANQYANGKGDHAVDVIVGAITSIHGEYEDGFKRAKIFAKRESGIEVERMITAIDNLCFVYKKVKP
ncbi:hypothetical protein QIA30_05385 (plasmid) [Borreliella turdi]|uniref:hypothetical protein n=1 Tax=Borreliella turdi TaxID=57863 RepID=UPI003AEFF0E1